MNLLDHYDHLMNAVESCNLPRVEQLLAQWPGDVNDHLLNAAISLNAPEIVAVLAPRAIDQHHKGLVKAVNHKFLDCVDVLLPYCSNEQRVNALGWAVENDFLRGVTHLAAHCDVYNSHSLFVAVLWRREEIFEFLFPLSDPWRTLNDMRAEFHTSPPSKDERENWMWFEQRMAEEQRKTLVGELPTPSASRAAKI